VLDSGHAVHLLAGHFLPAVEHEAAGLLQRAERDGGLDWDSFLEAWDRIVRSVVFGGGARDDRELTDMLTRLRADANWAFLKASGKNCGSGSSPALSGGRPPRRKAAWRT